MKGKRADYTDRQDLERIPELPNDNTAHLEGRMTRTLNPREIEAVGADQMDLLRTVQPDDFNNSGHN